MEKDIDNKIVVVTGASRGIGFGITKAFLEEGAKHAVILDIDEEAGIKTANDLNNQFETDKVTFYKCDVTTDLDEVFDKILDKFETFDVLVNNAGVMDELSVKRTIEINTVATVEWTTKFWNHVRKDKGGNGGTVINISSMYGLLVDPFCPFYKTSKAAVVAFTRTMGHKINYEQTGVRVLAICPTFVKTQMAENIKLNPNNEFHQEKFSNFAKKLKWLEVDDVSKATTETFKRAESGTVWSVQGDLPVTEVPIPTELRSEYLIQGEL